MAEPTSARCRNTKQRGLPADPASIEESAAAEEKDHDKDDEERGSVHVLNTGSSQPILSVQL